jgi:hypothetical protein
MWLPEKAVSSHALPPTDRPKFAIRPGGTLRRSLVTGYWTVVQHREVQPGRTLRACAYGFYRGHIARLFPLGEKIPVDSTTKSLTDEAGYALKIVVRLQTGTLRRAGRLRRL